MKHPDKSGEFGVYQEKVGLAIVVLIGGSLIGGGTIAAGINLGDRMWLFGGIGITAVSVVYFWICVLTTIAAGVDYVKLIADNQTDAIMRKAAQSRPSGTSDAALMRKLGKAIEDE